MSLLYSIKVFFEQKHSKVQLKFVQISNQNKMGKSQERKNKLDRNHPKCNPYHYITFIRTLY